MKAYLICILTIVSICGSGWIHQRNKPLPSSYVHPSDGESLLGPTVRYFKDSLKLTMVRQTGNTCLPAILAYTSQVKCNGRRTTEYFIDQYESSHPGVSVVEDGVVGSKKEISDYIQANFKTMPYDEAGGVVNSINAGCPLLTTIISFDMNGQRQAHSVLIVGYDSTSTPSPKIYYMDPLQGKVFKDMDVSRFEKSSPVFTFSIRDCK